jgi:hypothetical protein
VSSKNWAISKRLTAQDSITQNNVDISTPGVGFEPAIPVFEPSKTVWALDPAANVISIKNNRKRERDIKG